MDGQRRPSTLGGLALPKRSSAVTAMASARGMVTGLRSGGGDFHGAPGAAVAGLHGDFRGVAVGLPADDGAFAVALRR